MLCTVNRLLPTASLVPFFSFIILLSISCGRVHDGSQTPEPPRSDEIPTPTGVDLDGAPEVCRVDPCSQMTECGRVCANIIGNHNKIRPSGPWEGPYREARTVLFGDLYPEIRDGKRQVLGVYTNKWYDIGPSGVPAVDKYHVNCEHTWPKSKYSSNPRYTEIVSDLHHLFPAQERENALRGNHPFASCGPAGNDGAGEKVGRLCSDKSSYEPPDSQKGVAARAMFYIAATYGLSIDDKEEAFLRKWHVSFPVSAQEQQRMGIIEDHQGNQNPFIVHPDWVDYVQNF